MKIYFMLAYAQDKADAPMLSEVIANLSAEGFDVSANVSDAMTVSLDELDIEADLYILKSKTPLWLNIAAVLEAQGAHIINPCYASINTLNKIRAAVLLSAANIPIPRSWVTRDLAGIPDVSDLGPLLIKPNIGHGGGGIRIVRHPGELATTQVEDGFLVQEMITMVEDELKLYVIGDRVSGIRKHSDSGIREAVAVEPMLHDLAISCGRSLGLQIYGVDVLICQKGPIVVDVNYFPSFRGVSSAADQLTDHIGSIARK